MTDDTLASSRGQQLNGGGTLEGEAGDHAPAHVKRHGRRLSQVRWAPAAVLSATAIVLFLCYLRLSQSQPVNSDGAGNALQAWDLLHGNLLLHGWYLSDVSFYTTELPLYALVELVLGLSPEVIHVAAALTYTLLVAGVALLAKGRAGGAEGWLRMAIAAGVLLAPTPGLSIYLVLLSPDHVGTAVPLLVALLVLDRAPRRWQSATAIVALLLITQIADPLAMLEGAAPIAIVYAIRVYREIVKNRRLDRGHWFDLALVVGSLLTAGIASRIVTLIHQHGGFSVSPAPSVFATVQAIAAHVWIALESLLALNGADFTGQRVGLAGVLAALHIVGVALVIWGVARALRRFYTDDDQVVQVLVVAFCIVVLAYILGDKAWNVVNAREMAGALPFGAVLAGRLLAGRLTSLRLLPALGLVFAGYLITLLVGLTQPAPVYEPQQLASWLRSHHLYYGLGPYWESNVVTLDTGQHVQVRFIRGPVTGRLAMAAWETNISWYSPRLHDARFIVWSEPLLGPRTMEEATFGMPDHTYRVHGYEVLVYNHNLLTDLHGTFFLRERQHTGTSFHEPR